MIERTPDGHVYTDGREVKVKGELVTRDAWHMDLKGNRTLTFTPPAMPERYAPPTRLSLRESLEAYAGRTNMPVHWARPFWRAEALRLLNVAATVPCPRCGDGQVDGDLIGGPIDCYVCQDDTCMGTGRVAADTASGLCACAPGVAVPTAFVDWPDDYPGGAS